MSNACHVISYDQAQNQFIEVSQDSLELKLAFTPWLDERETGISEHFWYANNPSLFYAIIHSHLQGKSIWITWQSYAKCGKAFSNNWAFLRTWFKAFLTFFLVWWPSCWPHHGMWAFSYITLSWLMTVHSVSGLYRGLLSWPGTYVFPGTIRMPVLSLSLMHMRRVFNMES